MLVRFSFFDGTCSSIFVFLYSIFNFIFSVFDIQFKELFSIQTGTISAAAVSYLISVCFVALRPKSTAMVMAGRSVHLATLFPGQV